MPEITRRRTGELLRKLFELLRGAPEGLQAKETLAALERAVSLTDYESGDYEKGGRRFDKIVRFATVDCVKAGWMQKNKGRWTLLLRAMGYSVSWVAPPGKDGGTDIIALVYPLGTKPPRIKVQVKRQKDAASVQTVRSFIAVIGEADVGLFVCIGGFTRDAADEARTQEKRRVTLIDLDQLFEPWVQYYEKLSDEARQRLPLKPIHFLAPAP